MSGRCASKQRQRGLAMVEFTLCVPVILLLLFTTVEFARFLNQYSTLNNAVRDAARYVAGEALAGSGVLDTGAQWTALVSEGRNLAVYGNKGGTGTPLLPSLTTGQITITNAGNNNISVAAAYPYQAIFPVSMPDFFGGTISTTFTLNITSVMKAL